MRLPLSLLLASVLALVPVACGGGPGSPATAASAVPADVAAFFEVDATLDSEQWRRVQALLDRFPSRPQLVTLLNDQLREEELEWERDVAPALGDRLAVVVLPGSNLEGVVALTQPADEANLRALVAELDEETVIGRVGEWTAVASRQADIDALAAEGSRLADDDAFEGAVDELPDDALAVAFVRRSALPAEAQAQLDFEWFAAALEAQDDGAAVFVAARGAAAQTGEAYDSQRVDEAPGDALLFATFSAEGLRLQAAQLAPLEQLLGLPLQQLFGQLRGEAALWVRPAAGSIEATAAVEVEDEQLGLAAFESVVQRTGLPLQVGSVDGKIVLTTAASAEAALRPSGQRLGESADFTAAVEAAGMPGETGGFVYVNVGDALPLLSLVGAAGFTLPSGVLENLRPIRSVLLWSDPQSDRTLFRLFVEIQ